MIQNYGKHNEKIHNIFFSDAHYNLAKS